MLKVSVRSSLPVYKLLKLPLTVVQSDVVHISLDERISNASRAAHQLQNQTAGLFSLIRPELDVKINIDKNVVQMGDRVEIYTLNSYSCVCTSCELAVFSRSGSL